MKIRLVIILILIATLQLFSSNVEEKGFKGGINFSNLNIEGTRLDPQTKLTLGSYSTYKSDSFMKVQAEGYISWKGANIGNSSIDLIYLEIDYLARFDINKSNEMFPYFLVGPYLGINAKIEPLEFIFPWSDYSGIVNPDNKTY